MRLPFLALAITALLFLPAPGAAQERIPFQEFQLKPGDIIRVVVWREEDLSGEFVLDPNGTVVLPLLGERSVVGRPWEEVKAELLRDYRNELRNPSIELTPYRRVFVLGEVNQPGLYPVDPSYLSVAGAVALAGGATTQGDLTKIKIVREGELILEGVADEIRLAGQDIRSGDQIFVDRRGWFDRNSTFLVSAVLSVTTIVVTLVVK